MVKVQQGDTVVVFNPIGAAPGLTPPRFGADLALVSRNDPAYNGVANVSRGERVPFVIDGPGEYEVGGIFVRGAATDETNTAYALSWDEIRLVHLGALSGAELSTEVEEQLGAVDILFVPIDSLGPKPAAKLAAALDPRLIIPVDCARPADLEIFLKETGAPGVKPVESLTLKRKDLADKEAAVVVIKS